VVVAVDTRSIGNKNIVHLNGGRLPTEKQTLEWILEAESRGAGEILLTSMDHDGTKAGFDNGLLKIVNDAVHIPVIASGGAGSCSILLMYLRKQMLMQLWQHRYFTTAKY
jgi:cyclase